MRIRTMRVKRFNLQAMIDKFFEDGLVSLWLLDGL